jgi:hypothetical protein
MSDYEKRQTRAFKYRCRLCDELHNGAIGGMTVSEGHTILMELETELAVHRPGASITRHSFHQCKDGSFGISDIQGFGDK